ncbi:hypothetical protein CRYUN_Cryun15aG0010800 [Craigia yunnanensis]
MEEGTDVCLIPFEYSLSMTKTTRSDDNLVDTRTDQNPNNFHITFEFQVLNCLNFDNGDTDVMEEEFYDKRDWICSQFISNEACQFIFDQLELFGICSDCIDRILEATISEAMLALSNSKESSSQHHQELLSLCIYKYPRWEEAIDELESREVDKQVPATKESIDALKKAKLEDGVSGCLETCVICYENLWQETTMEVTGLPCSHLFHGKCIVEWLNRSHLCPLCGYEMPTS